MDTTWIYQKDRSLFNALLLAGVNRIGIPRDISVLILGGSDDDVHSLSEIGFTNVANSNIGSGYTQNDVSRLDLEALSIEVDKYDMIFIHEALHHCASPHLALCESLRTAKKFVVFMEPNDSSFMRLMTKLKMTNPFEVNAVLAHGGIAGGLRNSCVPNFIYRWDAAEVQKVVNAYLAARDSKVQSYPYWDFNISADDLEKRQGTRLGLVFRFIRPSIFLKVLRTMQKIFNQSGMLRSQGNKFLCMIEKTETLKPWLLQTNGAIAFNLKRYHDA